MDFFDKTGKMAMGSRLRMLTDRVTADAAAIYELYGLDVRPKWFPVLFTLADGGEKTITGIAREIGHSHPSVSNIVREMTAGGLVRGGGDKNDRRRNVVRLSAKGRRTAAMLGEVCGDVAAAVDNISRETRNDLWRAIAEWEELLDERSLLERVRDVRRAREAGEVSVVAYEERWKDVFRRLNEMWITEHWQLEPHDIECLEHPQETIIDRGGHIFVALYRGEPAGVCALCRMDDPRYDYELAKLAVSPDARGKGIGLLLCRAAVDKARQLGAKRIFLESNTLLKPAIHTYRKLGFRELAEYHPAYARGDIQMELLLDREDRPAAEKPAARTTIE